MKSMTGFGLATVGAGLERWTAEARSVNSRFLELKLVLPREHQDLEHDLREGLQAKLSRGRVDVAVRREGTAAVARRAEIDLEGAAARLGAWRRLQRELKVTGEIDLAFLREIAADAVRSTEVPRDRKAERALISRAVAASVAALEKDRAREGRHLSAELRRLLGELGRLHGNCVQLAAGMRGTFTARLEKRLATLLADAGLEASRLVTEVALLVERSDIAEELARLDAHIEAFRALLREREPVGKRIEFLLQEIHREVNTIGSKANHLPLTQAVLEAKAVVEKLREQAANVE